MKRCPECRRDYFDDSLLYCLDDGTALLEGPASMDEPATAILHETASRKEAATRAQIDTTGQTAVFPRGAEAEPQENLGGLSEKRSFSARRAKPLVIITVAAVVLLGGFVGYRYFPSPGTKQIESIAVMPFSNESGNADLEYLSDGMTETLMGSLSEVPNLSVKARSSVFRYKGKETDVRTIGKELNVQAIVNGRVAQRGDELSLSLELVDAQSENLIWSGRYSRKRTDLISLQSEIARDVSQKLKTKLSGADQQRVVKTYTESPEAYQLFERGRFYWNKRTVPDLERAIEYFNQAIATDPNYALAHAGLSNAYINLSQNAGTSPGAPSMARAAALKAVALDDNLAEAHTALASVLEIDYDPAGAERAFKRSIELNANYATAHQWYGMLLSQLGRHDEGLAELRRALDLDPFSLIINKNYANALSNSGRYDESIEQFKKTIELDPNFPFAHEDLSLVYQKGGKYQESVEEFARYQESIGEQQAASLIRESYAQNGWQGFLRLMTSEPDRVKMSASDRAIYRAAIGDIDGAIDLLESEFPARNGRLLTLKVEPLYEPLRNHPRFKELLKKVGFAE